jgi:hypothetical protein
MPGRGRPADNRSRSGTPQGAAPLAGGQVPSNGSCDIGTEAPRARKMEDRRLELGTNPLQQPNRRLGRTKLVKGGAVFF